MPGFAPLNVRIIGGESVVGETIAILLRRLGYEATFHPETSEGIEAVQALIPHSDVVILMPGIETGLRDMIVGESEAPVLEMITPPRQPATGAYTLLWPCRMEELRDAIHIFTHE